jgi:PAS domain S-box-containing protein
MPLSKLSPGEQADFFRLVLDSTVEGVYTIDSEGRTTSCNAACLSLLGFDSADEVLGLKLHEVIHNTRPDGTPYTSEDCPISEAAHSGVGRHIPHGIFHRRDGSAFPVEYRAQPIRKDGVLMGAICTFVDISDRVAADEKLNAVQQVADSASERINLALDSGVVLGTWVWDIPHDLVYGDERFARSFSVSEASALNGLPFETTVRTIHPEDIDGLRTAVTQALKGAAPFRAEYRLREGDAWRWVEASGAVARNATGEPVRFPGVLIDIDERKRTEQALKDSNEKLRMAQSAGGVIGTWFWDLPQQKVTGDEGFARTFGIDPEALAKGVSFDLVGMAVHPDDLAIVIDAVEKTMITGETCIIDYRVRDGDGWRWINATGKAQLNAAGQAINQSGMIIDISERKRFEETLQQTHDQLRMAQKVGGIGVFAMRTGAEELVVSDEFCTIFGVPVASTVSLPDLASLVLDEDRTAQSTDEDRAAGTTPSETEYRIQRPDTGEVRWIYRRAEFIRDDDGQPLHMVGMVQDITERKTAALRLRESQAYLNLMLESVQDYAIISLDEAGRIVLWNAGAQKIFGYKPKDVLDQHVEMIFTPEDRAHGAPRTELAVAATNTRASDERWHMRQNGERFYASGTMAAMYDDEGRVKGFIKICRDMTAQQQAQEALLEARNAAEAANIAKTEFLANMSHEIRTPMNAIIGLSTILSKSQPLTPRQTEYIRTLSNSADSLLALINDLLDIAKIEARTVELENIPFSLTRLMQEVTSMMAVSVREKGLAFISEGACVEERVFVGDPTRMRQIIVNLCSNAIKFTEAGEVKVAITCRPAEAADHEIICLTVSDSGIGIAPEKLDSIFHKFVQADTSINRKYGGTGLGLAITRTLVEIMGGSIKVSSTPGEGSTFEVLLPLQIATSDQVARSEYSLAAVQEGRVEKHLRPPVLLVEDYEPNILVATTFLEDFGYNVDIARNGLEAFESVKRTRYVAVLMDVQMHGMNGLDATRLIRQWEETEDKPRVRIIGMTAHALAGDRERCLSVGMDDYVAKPFRPEELRRKIETEP